LEEARKKKKKKKNTWGGENPIFRSLIQKADCFGEEKEAAYSRENLAKLTRGPKKKKGKREKARYRKS